MIIKLTNNNHSFHIKRGKYRLHYELGKITETVPGTVGIFCYDLGKRPKFNAFLNKDYFIFYEVEGIGEPRKKVHWCCLPNDYLESFYSNKTHYHNPISIPDTVVFNAVKPIRVIPKDELEFIYWKGGI